MVKYPIRCPIRPDLAIANDPNGQRWLHCRFPYTPFTQRVVMYDLYICGYHWESIPGVRGPDALDEVGSLVGLDVRIPVRSEIQATDFEWTS